MVDKISAIRFLIEDCYKNFPELIEEIPKEEMYKILENNISSIEVEEESEDYDGLYNVSEKTISLVNKNENSSLFENFTIRISTLSNSFISLKYL